MGQEVGAANIPNRRCTASPSKVITGKRLLGFERFEIRHDIAHLTGRELISRHHRVNPLEQRSLQVCNWIPDTASIAD